jgi:hypothetical protein
MTPVRRRPPFVADERTQLVGWLDLQRAIVHLKCEGLSDADAHRSVLPGSPLMTMAGAVSHLRWAEHCWFEVVFLGRPAAGPQFDDGPEDAGTMVLGQPLGRLLAGYERQCTLSNEIAAAHALDDVGRHQGFRAAAATLRWILIHMVEETARHAGRMDAVRELLGGQKGATDPAGPAARLGQWFSAGSPRAGPRCSPGRR